jgi:hypothetical protein
VRRPIGTGIRAEPFYPGGFLTSYVVAVSADKPRRCRLEADLAAMGGSPAPVWNGRCPSRFLVLPPPSA